MSFVLSALKNVKERLDKNYSSAQLLTTLDTLLLYAIKPLLRKTKFVDRQLAIICGWYTNAARRKIASLESKELFITLVSAFLLSTDYKERVELFQKLKLERSLTFWILHRWVFLMADFEKAASSLDFNRMHEIERQAYLIDLQGSWQTLRQVQYWADKALGFKHAIMEKYMRLVMLESQAYYAHHKRINPHINVNLDDVAQNFVLAVSKAIDKCDVTKGTLTSYIQMWLKDARNTVHFRHDYGFSYSIPTNKRRDIATGKSSLNNIMLDLNSIEAQSVPTDTDIEHEIDRKKNVNLVRKLAKQVDPTGLGRLSLHITETLSDKELQLLETGMENK